MENILHDFNKKSLVMCFYESKNEIILFENQGVKLEVNLKDETVWLTQKQMAELFDKDRRTITRHIQNIYKDNELSENSVCSFFEHTAEDGKKYTELLVKKVLCSENGQLMY